MTSTARWLPMIVAVGIVGLSMMWPRAALGQGAATVRGRVIGTSGPVEGVKVAIFRNAEVSVCFLGLTDCDDDQLASTVSGHNGLYELVVRPELRSWAPKGFSVRVSRPASPGSSSGASSYQQLETLVEEQTIPDIFLWDRRPVITEDRGLLLVETVLPDDGSRRGTSDFVADDGSYSRFPTADGAVDARLIADRSTLVSSYLAGSTSEGVSYKGSLVPPSRGRPCTFGPTAKALEPCPFTDGSFLDVAGPAFAGLRESERNLVIDLGGPINVGLVVVDGCDLDCTVAVSEDGETWHPLEAVSAQPVDAFAPARPAVSNFVRVDGMLVAEVAVWPPAVGRDGEPVLGLLTRDVIANRPERPVTSRTTAIAVVLLLGVFLASVREVRRRRL